MFLNSVITNPGSEPVSVSFLGKGVLTIAPGESMTLSYDVISRCKGAVHKTALANSLSSGLLHLQYITDLPIGSIPKAPEVKKSKPAKKVVEPAVKKVEVAPEEVVVKVDENKKADKKEAINLFAEKGEKKVEKKTINISDLMEGKVNLNGDSTEKAAKPFKKESAPVEDKAPAKKRTAKKASSKKTSARKGSKKVMS